MKKLTALHKLVRRPAGVISTTTKVFSSIKDYSREQNYLEIDSYLDDISEEEVTLGTEER
jgi:hypothetical protein